MSACLFHFFPEVVSFELETGIKSVRVLQGIDLQNQGHAMAGRSHLDAKGENF